MAPRCDGEHSTSRWPWVLVSLVAVTWYTWQALVSPSYSNGLGVTGLLVLIPLCVWMFNVPLPTRTQNARAGLSHYLACALLSSLVVGAAVVPSISHKAPSIDMWIISIVICSLAMLIILSSWGIWSIMVGLMLTIAGARIRPKWLIDATGQWIPWMLAGITVLSAYQLLLVPNLLADHIAVKMPTSIVFGTMYSVGVVSVSQRICQDREQISLYGITPLKSTFIVCAPTLVLQGIAAIISWLWR